MAFEQEYYIRTQVQDNLDLAVRLVLIYYGKHFIIKCLHMETQQQTHNLLNCANITI